MERITVPTNQSVRLPKRLKKDAIVEALWEVRFESVESREVPELVVGMLAGHVKWEAFRKKRLPLSDVPAPVRQQDPSLKNQATLELRDTERSRVVKIGSNVFSYHVLIPYCGGDQFKQEISDAIDFVFTSLQDFRATRFGWRYINAMNEQDHKVKSVVDLNLKIDVANESLTPPLNLNFKRERTSEHYSLVRIASPEFVSGPANIAMTALIDVDVFTPPDFQDSDPSRAKDWIERAHVYEKEEFFRLIPEHIFVDLVEERKT